MASNTHGADINELALGFFLNGEKWYDRSASAEAKFKEKKRMVSNDELLQQMGRAKAMSHECLAYIRTRYGNKKIKNVWWTARMGSLGDAVGRKDVDQRKNPTDILVQLSDGTFIGFSAKSTQGKSDIGFKNPGLGTVEKALKIDLNRKVVLITEKYIKQFNLPPSTSARKSAIRAKPAIKAVTEVAGVKLLADIRDTMLKRMASMSQPALRKYIIDYWMDANEGAYPPYVKVTGFGKTAPFTAKISDPLKNEKMTYLQTKSIKLEKVGNESIGVSAGGHRLMKMRAKFESEKLASSIKFSGEPW